MNKPSLRFRLVDALLILMMILPFAVGMALKVLYTPPSEGINITGALIFFRLDFLPLGGLPITESQVNSWLVMISVTALALYLTHGITARGGSRRQHLAEWIVEQTDHLIRDNMGPYFASFSPFIGAVLALSAFSSLSSLVGLYPPTSDINVVAGWSILVFLLITYYKLKCGPIEYLKGFTEPFVPFTPFNIISEVATPISMAFRHYGNVLSGTVISALIAAGLGGLSSMVLGWLPGALGQFPLLRIGVPAVLSIYFDVFSGCVQAFIFAMLTMLYVSGAFPEELYFARKAKKQNKIATVNK